MKTIITDGRCAEKTNPFILIPGYGIDKIASRQYAAFTDCLLRLFIPAAEDGGAGQIDEDFLLGGYILPWTPDCAVSFYK